MSQISPVEKQERHSSRRQTHQHVIKLEGHTTSTTGVTQVKMQPGRSRSWCMCSCKLVHPSLDALGLQAIKTFS
jgi:hypothetical protein